MRNAIIIGLAAVGLLTSPAAAKRERLMFFTGMCETEVTFDSKKTPEAAVKDSGWLLYEDISSPIAAFPPTPPEGVPANIAAYEGECAALKARLTALNLLPIKGLEERRAERLMQVDDVCRFGLVKLKGQLDGAAYRSYPAPACERFLAPLEGKAAIEPLLDEIQAAQCKSMDKPDDCFKDELGPRDAAEFQQRARDYVANYGWNNCAVDFLAINQTEKEEQTLETLRTAFEKRFKIKKRCEEP
jgi:hypothetical protein